MTAAIADVGHVVTSHGLTVGDLELADFASYVARAAAPYDEVANLDRVEVERALGNDAAADLLLREGVSTAATTTWVRFNCPPGQPGCREQRLGGEQRDADQMNADAERPG